jgi:hypothetical protein
MSAQQKCAKARIRTAALLFVFFFQIQTHFHNINRLTTKKQKKRKKKSATQRMGDKQAIEEFPHLHPPAPKKHAVAN